LNLYELSCLNHRDIVFESVNLKALVFNLDKFADIVGILTRSLFSVTFSLLDGNFPTWYIFQLIIKTNAM